MADNGAHVDPKRLREFANTITQTSAAYSRAMEQLDGDLSRLLRTWRDDQGADFAKEVKRTRQIVHEFVQAANEARGKLLTDADAAEAYQRINLR
jgi:uncharacterized protein YukE